MIKQCYPTCVLDISQNCFVVLHHIAMITVPIDSRYVNAIIYIVFDVALCLFFGSLFRRIQSSVSAKRLMQGKLVSLKESPLQFFTGGILYDDTFLSVLLISLHFLLLVALFSANLGINGRTIQSKQRIYRRYRNHLALQDGLVRDFRRSPPLFSSCVASKNGSVLYYPSAFNMMENNSIANDVSFEDNNGNIIQVNATSLVCQNFGEYPPSCE